MHLKANKVMQQGSFFCHCSLATAMTNVVQIFTDLLCFAYDGIHQVRKLVFDNYQTCPMPSSVPKHPCKVSSVS